MEHLQLFFTDAIIADIAQQSNLYYKKKGKVINNWRDITPNEIKAFLGIILAMGLVDLPKFTDYWAKDGIVMVPWFSSIMTRTRFYEILSNIHLSNDENQTNGNKLAKLGNLAQLLNNTFHQRYTPSRNLSVDEQMIGTKCRISFIQYMPKKPTKFGIKVWVLCEAETGYCQQFQIYTGKIDGNPEKGLAKRVVLDLLENYLDKKFHVYWDNFYSTKELFDVLEKKQTYACGTVRKDRGNFPDTFHQKLKRGQMVFLRDKNLVAVHWFDKRDVYAMSSIHGTSKEDVIRRGDTEPVEKPKIIIEYNKYMNGVDKRDQYFSSYPF